MSRLIAETRADGETAQYRYDVAGNAVWIKDSYGETVNEFDANGNVIAVKDAKTGKLQVRYERDAQGNKTAVYLADGSMIRYDYDELGVYRGYEFVEPGRQPHGTVPGANYKPSPLVPPAEETKNWKKTDALKEADKQIQKAKFAEYAAEVAYVEAEAMAPGSAQAKRAKAAYAQTKKAVDAAYAAKDAIADAKTQREISRAVTGAQIASGTADRAVDAVTRSADSAAAAKKAKQAEEELKKAVMTLAAELETVEKEAACNREKDLKDKFIAVGHAIESYEAGKDAALYRKIAESYINSYMIAEYLFVDEEIPNTKHLRNRLTLYLEDKRNSAESVGWYDAGMVSTDIEFLVIDGVLLVYSGGASSVTTLPTAVKSASGALVMARELAVAGVAVWGIALVDAIGSEIHLVKDIDRLFGGGGDGSSFDNGTINEENAGNYRLLSKKEIQQLGGETSTQKIKADYGGSRSDLRIDRYGNVYVVRKGNTYGEFIGTLEELLAQYGR